MNRRAVLTAFAWVPILGAAAPAQAPQEGTQVVWRLPAQSLPTAKKYLGQPESVVPEQGAATDTRGLPLILIVTAVALLPQLAEAVVSVYRDYRYGGVIITAKKGHLDVSTDQRIPANTVIVQSDNDVKVYEKKNPDAAELKNALGTILSQMSK